ncbi:cytochrome c oxidase subunit 3 [Hyphomicrobium sp.]|uniref:cytochrome c oxidase subunit 3 n=1 Tax=Hyphomicrobium sp. TaxID=82 RepID=UPI002FDE5292
MAQAHGKQHDYHLLDPSPWPILAALSALVLAIGGIIWMRSLGEGAAGLFGVHGSWVFYLGAACVITVAAMWWRDVVIEAQRGDHTPVVQLHLRYGIILFIASEVMFFVAWFWAYFDFALFPGGVYTLDNVKEALGLVQRNELFGGVWPPVPVDSTDAVVPATGAPADGYFKGTFDPWGIPLVNTLILLTSGCTVTWAHHCVLKNDRRGLVLGLAATVALGFIFTCFQAYEYMHAAFTFGGHGYGATFYMATGFHGGHVIIGTIFLAVCLLRALKGHFTPKQHFGFEAAAWYWHFVDVVWLFLFASIYVWGAGPNAGAVH